LGQDPQVILINGILCRNNTATANESWYYLREGIADLSSEASGNYSVVLLDNQQKMIGRFYFNASFTYLIDEMGNLTTVETDTIPFIFNIPYINCTAVIEIRNATDYILVSRIATSNAPTVNVISPNGGETLTAGINYTISWSGSDLDGDGLAYPLAYSEDGGENLVPLAIDLNQTSYVWDTSYLQKASNYLVKVIATDGVNTGEDVSDSTFSVKVHDVATTNVTPFKTIVGQGYSLDINITIANKGDFTEVFNVSVFYDDTAIILPDGKNYTTTTLTSGNSTTLTLTWNTTGFAKGNYTIKAYAIPVPGETDTTDNKMTDGWVIVAMVGDITGLFGVPDGIVDIFDLVYLATSYGATKGEPKYKPNADINNDGIIDIFDLVALATHYGETDP